MVEVEVWSPRLVGAVVTIISMISLCKSLQRRKEIFHRLALGMGFHGFIFGICYMVGPAAIPKDDENAVGNAGTVATCSAQGFLIYVSLLTATSYYALGFSTYSYVGVLNNFDRGKIYWIEKWIHSLVHLFPVVLGLSLLGLGAINNGGHGYCIPVISSPLGCNDPDIGVECERGPKRQQEYRAMQLFWIIPYSLLIIFPAIIMFILYLTVKKQQTDIHIKANVLLLQAFLFLIGEYFLIVPLLTHNVIVIAGAKPNSTSALFVYIGYFFFNCWTLFAYLYFSRYGSESKEGESTQQSSEYSFNIFDGTNAAGEFAQYVHGASNDEVEDDMQDHKEWEEAQPQT